MAITKLDGAWQMRASQLLAKHIDEIKSIARRYEKKGLHNLRIFGSVAKGVDTEKSDIDFLVDAAPDVTLLIIGGMHFELEQLLGARFDLITSGSIPEDLKYLILEEARPI